jgi:hypothetical protein
MTTITTITTIIITQITDHRSQITAISHQPSAITITITPTSTHDMADGEFWGNG